MAESQHLADARRAISHSRRMVVLTGAGISAESGIPTFRGAGGLWRDFRPEDLATPVAFARDPVLVWQWYEWRRGIIAAAEPNAGHHALAALQKQSREFTLITQNVDGLHERAGSRDVLRLHGSIWRTLCPKCGVTSEDLRVPLPTIPPTCVCGSVLRPDIVWFGESLPSDVWQRAEAASYAADVFLVVGTSAVVYPAASLVPLAARAGATVIEINPEATPLSDIAVHSLRGPAGEVIPMLVT